MMSYELWDIWMSVRRFLIGWGVGIGILFIASCKFVVLLVFVLSYLVVNVESKLGKASVPILFIVISGFVINKIKY